MDGARSGLRVRPQPVVRVGAAPGPATRSGGFPSGGPGRGRMGTTRVPAEPEPPLTILGERQRQQQQKRREHQRGAHRVLASDPEQVAAGLAEGPGGRAAGAWAPLGEAWRWLGRPGADPRLPSRAPQAPPRGRCGRAGPRRGARRQRSGGRLRRGRRLRGCGPAGGCCDSGPVCAGPRPLPSPRTARAGRRGRAGRCWAENNEQRRKLRPGARRAGERGGRRAPGSRRAAPARAGV